MSSKYFPEKSIYAFIALTLLALLLAGCGGAGANTATVSTSLSNNTITTPVGGTSAIATLKHQPAGTINLSWDSATHMLTAQLMLTGLAPNSVHPVHINQGSCGDNTGSYDRTLYSLANLSADSRGVLNVTKKIKVTDGIPARNWYVDIHNGPDLATSSQTASIACANIVNHDTSLRSTQATQATFQPTSAGNQDVSGVAHLNLSGHTLTVQLVVSGLVPKSEHMVHIHAGSCASQGSVIYPLTPVKADSSGKATVTTTIQNVMTIPASGWYVNLHESTDLSTQTGFDPISCGDVVLDKA